MVGDPHIALIRIPLNFFFLGTSFAPVVGARIAEDPSISWRWTDWIAVIMASTTFIITILCLPETFTPIMLKWKAEKIRKITGDNRYIAQIESQSTFLERFKGVLTRALTMVTKEVCIFLLSFPVFCFTQLKALRY